MVRLATCLLVAIFLILPLSAQTLARPGWVGSGLAAEPWWRSAVYYRIDVPYFQDSNGDARGDLPGVAQRLDYLQTLGVDAIILQPPFAAAEFDDLLREASRRHVRLVVELQSPATDPAALLVEARQWLSRGAAGIAFSPSGDTTTASTTTLLADLHKLADSFPGERALISEPPPGADPDTTIRASAASLTAVQLGIDSGILRTLAAQNTTSLPLLVTDTRFRSANVFYAQDPTQLSGMNKVLAVALFASHGAVSLRYGQELGLASLAGRDEPRTMQWTPSNLTQPKAPNPADAASDAANPSVPENSITRKPAPPQPPPAPQNTYGAFVPYVAPRPIVLKPAPAGAARVDPDTLPGFSSTPIPKASDTNAATANAAVEDADPTSLLNFYRRLAQLHRGNPSVRSGATVVLDHDSDGALVWLRNAPRGSRTASTVVITCNLNDKPITLSLRADFDRLHLRTGYLRPLLASWTETPIAQPDDRIELPPHSAFIAELYHGTR